MALHPPIPVQDELLPVDEVCLLDEYRATFRNEMAHMPEVSLRYLLLLVLTDQPLDEVKRFANQVRLDLNEQRLSQFIKEAPFTGPNNSVRHALAVG